jgi:hypothetical protein
MLSIRFVTRWIGVGYGSAVDHIVVGVHGELHDLEGHAVGVLEMRYGKVTP